MPKKKKASRKHNKMVYLNSTISVTTLSINRQNIPIKKQDFLNE